MDEEVKQAVESTIAVLQPLIKRPRLKPDWVARPPFRFLHDVVTNVCESTGFAPGLYDDDEVVDPRKMTKPLKIVYLEKIIAVVGLAVGQHPFPVKPSKIVAGLEVLDTNNFLQHLAMAARDKDIDSARIVKFVLHGEDSAEESEHEEAPPEPEPVVTQPPPEEKPREVTPPEPAPVYQPPKPRTPSPPPQPVVPKSPTPPPQEPSPRPPSSGRQSSRQSVPSSSREATRAEPVRAEVQEGGSGAQASHIAQGSVRPGLPRTARKPPPSRTSSSRADDRSTQASRQSEAAMGLIIEGEENAADEEDAIQEEEEEGIEGMEGHVRAGVDVSDPSRRGQLVRDILESQQQFGEKGGQGTTSAPRVEQLVSHDDIKKLREAIQGLSKSTLPLGKAVDYLQEDLESMRRDLTHWQEESRKYREKCAEAKRVTEESSRSGHDALEAIENEIAGQKDKIRQKHVSILYNQGQLETILSGIVAR